MSTLTKIQNLIKRFESQKGIYQQDEYSEAQTRIDFVNPFFMALGWDIDNKQRLAEPYRQVIYEDILKIDKAPYKRPDYSFRVGGVRKFFVEAKKPSINLKKNPEPAYQLRRYGWNAKLSLSIITNFAEFAVYDCRIKPEKDDAPSVGRVLYLKYTDYLESWEELVKWFSFEAVWQGKFDQYAAEKAITKGAIEVDTAFLNEMELWREKLAHHIFAKNPSLTQRQLNFVVQQTIDRIVFLRICEDRGIEDYGRLLSLTNGKNSYKRLFELFIDADARYNSGLFHFKKEKEREQPDKLTPHLKIGDDVLQEIIVSLYYPKSPYEFSVLPADILGQVYERFLGKIIRLTNEHEAIIEEKPEVKKAGGVYYTPSYIVDYIVKQTLTPLLKGKKVGTRSTVNRLKILDPACGSGSFLLGAYQFLLDWHLQQYLQNPEKWTKGKNPRLYQAIGKTWKLTVEERKRILLNNIYGVDIDFQAVEVTKLSLLLKVLEDEQSVISQLSLLKERVLPDIDSNIKCGNSLIGNDFYQEQQLGFLDEETLYQINAFDWEAEFADMIKAGGFDAVIGNPPWGASFSENELEYLRQKNKEVIVRMIDSFMYFVYQGSKKMNPKGHFGMIVPDVIFYQQDNEKLRHFILNNFAITALLNMGDVFEKVTRPSCILAFSKDLLDNLIKIADFSHKNKLEKSVLLDDDSCFGIVKQEHLLKIPGSLFITSNSTKYTIWTKVKSISHQLLISVVDEDGIQRGVSPDLKKAFIVDAGTIQQYHLETSKLKKVLTGGKQVKRYFIDYPEQWLIYTTRFDDFSEIPNIIAYIDQFKDDITCVEVKQDKHPLYSLHRPRRESIFLKSQKLLGVITTDKMVIALDESQTFATDGLYIFGVQDHISVYYLIGILNSKLFVFVYRLLTLEKGRVLAQVKPAILSKLPIRIINFDNPTDKTNHDKIVKLVEQMQTLNKKRGTDNDPQTQTVLERRIKATDKQINQLVYTLYDLTAKEIEIVEKGD
ncbi:N-6 DNA methylase [Candidatus Parabeggiatoa sp. HSG14]|uniref:Eco57I restriction-modification methylase domain-containing protein n=1 Tax=Candidatus Parabeggiatoa sp. HSG14 TaxID=3055593 RepID=UPI0025A6CCBC|nr:N-6 DNA methylase [Thiotrichales bacterium HSG14]